MSDKSQNPAGGARSTTGPTYAEWQDAFPNVEPTVRIIFHGLLCFFFDGSTKCTVGTHNTTQEAGNPHPDHKHEYRVNIWLKDNGSCPLIAETYAPQNSKGFHLDINASGAAFPGGVAPGVYVYTGPQHAQFNRQDGDDVRDWRWIIDFERDVYNVPVKGKRPAALDGGIEINNGLFYTFHKTQSKYALRPEDGSADKPLNGIAVIQAADIYLAPGGSVTLTGDRWIDRELKFKAGRTYQVDIFNLCDGSQHPACKYDNANSTKETRNDFFLYYETFDLAQNGKEYQLVRTSEKKEPPVTSLCPSGETFFGTDDTPCGGVGFGLSPDPRT